jgi:hypothetical protein
MLAATIGAGGASNVTVGTDRRVHMRERESDEEELSDRAIETTHGMFHLSAICICHHIQLKNLHTDDPADAAS